MQDKYSLSPDQDCLETKALHAARTTRGSDVVSDIEAGIEAVFDYRR